MAVEPPPYADLFDTRGERLVEEGKEVRKNDQAFSIKLRDFYKLDLGVKYRINKASRTATWSLDIMNATNHENVGGVYYDVNYNETRSWTMMPMVPVLSYKLDF